MADRAGRSAAGLIAALALCYGAAAIGAAVTAPRIPTWYRGLDKPAFTPPDRAFPIVWTLLYGLMAVALWRGIERAPPGHRAAIAVPFAAQLGLNVGWSFAFFGRRSPGGGVAVIVPLLGAIGWTIAAFRPVDRLASRLLLPYAVWVGFAALLNASIWAMNG